MARRIRRAARQELVRAVGERDRAGSRAEKARILGELVAVTGYHRKHALRLLGGSARSKGSRTPARSRGHDEAVREALIVLWEASDRVCGKRLRPLLPLLIQALERHGHLCLDDLVRAKLLAASAATLDRVLAPTRAAVRNGPSRPRAAPAIRRSVAVRTYPLGGQSQRLA
jgi:hypothetical protein